MTLSEWQKQALVKLPTSESVPDPAFHLQQLMQGILKLTSSEFIVQNNETLSSKDLANLEDALSRRLEGEPLQYILEVASFWKQEFKVGPGVLIPRKETEHVVEHLLRRTPEVAKVIELGAGSGNIGLSVLATKTRWNWVACEKSKKAADFARGNAKRLMPTAQYQLVEADFFDAVENFPGPYQYLVSNPPYIATAQLKTLSLEVQSEPRVALDGGPDGLDVIRRLAAIGPALLAPQGEVVLEIGSDQEKKVVEIFTPGYSKVQIFKDLAGLPRVLVAKV